MVVVQLNSAVGWKIKNADYVNLTQRRASPNFDFETSQLDSGDLPALPGIVFSSSMNERSLEGKFLLQVVFVDEKMLPCLQAAWPSTLHPDPPQCPVHTTFAQDA